MGKRGPKAGARARREALTRGGVPNLPPLEESSLWNDLQDQRAATARNTANCRNPQVTTAFFDEEPWSDPDLSRSERVIRFCETLQITSGVDVGKRLKLRSWQREFIEAVYRVDENGNRPVRSAILSMARKNGKTQLAACLALCHLLGPEAENRGEVYSCANDRFQASKIFHEMVALIQACPGMADRVNILRFQKVIEDLKSGSIYVALSAEAKTKMGLSPSFCVYDELGVSTDRSLYDAMDSAMGARKDPLLLVISTQAPDHLAPMSQLIDYGLKIEAGEIVDSAFYLKFHAAPESADPWSPETWKLANPALGDFRSLEDVERQAMQAQRIPAQESRFRNLTLNQRVSPHAKFIERSDWMECAGTPEIPPGVPVFAGLDLGETQDLTALVVIHQDVFGIIHVQPHYWLPGDVLARTDQDHVPYDAWVRQGFLMSAGVTTDPAMIALKVAEINARNPIQTLGFDRWKITAFKRELDEINCPVQLVEYGQGFKDMTPALGVVYRMIKRKLLRHGAHPVLMSNVANATVTLDPAGGMKLDKSKSTGRIDGLVALTMALGTALIKNEQPIDIRALIG